MYVLQPSDFKVKGTKDRVYKLYKALYGLKQAPRVWNKMIDSFFMYQGFNRCTMEHGVYMRGSRQTNVLLVCLYVDDMLVSGSCSKEIEEFNFRMKEEFEVYDFGKLSYFLTPLMVYYSIN